MKTRKKWILVSVIAVIIVAVASIAASMIMPQTRIKKDDVSHTVYAGIHISKAASEDLITLINKSFAYPCTKASVEPSKPGADSKIGEQEITIAMRDGSWYTLSYRYVSGYSFNPFHSGEDDFQSYLAHYDALGRCVRALSLEYDFDAEFLEWMDFSGEILETVSDAPCALFIDAANPDRPLYVDSEVFSLNKFFPSLILIPIDGDFPGEPLYTICFNYNVGNAREIDVLINASALSIDGQLYSGIGFSMKDVLEVLESKYEYLAG